MEIDKNKCTRSVDSGYGSIGYKQHHGRKPFHSPPPASSKNIRTVPGQDVNDLLTAFANLKGPLETRNFTGYRTKGCNKNLHHIKEDTSEDQSGSNRCVENEYAQIAWAWMEGNDYNTSMWSSKTFPWEFALPVQMKDDAFKKLCTFILLVSTVKSPGLFLFAIVSKGTDRVWAETEDFTVHVARHLRRALTKVLKGEIPYILPGVFSAQEFSIEAIAEKVDQGWNNKVEGSPTLINAREMFDKGPTFLSSDHFQQVTTAVRTCSRLSDVPGFLDVENKNKVYRMDTAHTDAVLRLVRHLFHIPRSKQTVLCDMDEIKCKCAILEAASRVGPQQRVKVFSADSNIKSAAGNTGCDLDLSEDDTSQPAILCMDHLIPSALERMNNVLHFRKAGEAATAPNNLTR